MADGHLSELTELNLQDNRGLGDEGGLSVDSTLGGEHLASTLTSVPLTTADPHLYIVPAPSAPTRKYI